MEVMADRGFTLSRRGTRFAPNPVPKEGSAMPRPSGREANEIRHVRLEPGYAKYAEGSCLTASGETRVQCYTTVEEKVQRLIGRSLRAVIDCAALGERQVLIDCDVLQADGGTRTAAITGSYVALYLAMKKLVESGALPALPLSDAVAAVSCGIVGGQAVLDLDYVEDSGAEADANFVFTGKGGIIEVQATAEKTAFAEPRFMEMLALGRHGVEALVRRQREALGIA